jgi:hypothetical protein
MNQGWLVPIISDNPITFGADRLPCNGQLADEFLKRLSTSHSRCLLSFKAQLLLSDEAEEACGGSDFILNWAGDNDIAFDRDLSLSHCAEAFLNFIPDTVHTLTNLENIITSGWDEVQLAWLETMKEWLTKGYRVILIKVRGVKTE